MKIIFMGSPSFAVPTLHRLINSTDHQVVSVFTQAPKAKGRGMNTALSPVHQLAEQHNIPTYTPVTLKTTEAENLIKSIAVDVIVVVAYGFIIPPGIIQAKKYGCLNIHPSLLPKYRGAAPMQRTIINGDKETAICIMQMDEGLDTGDIIIQHKFPLASNTTFPELHDICANMGADLLVKVLDNIETLPRIRQAETGATYAHKLGKEEGNIDWNETAYQIDCKIRGMNPWPGVYFTYNGKIIKILEADYTKQGHDLLPGAVINNKLEIACGQGTLLVKKLQQAGKMALGVAEFLRGTPIPKGVILSSKVLTNPTKRCML